jgi:glycyl-tRNA synthetase beta chain
VYHNKLGTQRDRVDRLVSLATRIQEGLPRGAGGVEWAVRAAYLAKADLVTLMVGEFPELQGIMGRHYAEADGEPPSVARAIEQHYWPRFAGDALPTGDASIALALADRLDALVGMFSIGQVPTGDKDPFALRRAALGIVRILMETKPALAMELRPLLRAAAKTLQVKAADVEALVSSVELFVRDRLANLMRERGYTAHEVASVLEVQGPESKPDRLDLVPAKLDAVRAFSKLPEAESLAAANKRIQNILRKSPSGGAVDYALLQLPEERKLRQSLTAVEATVNERFAAGDFTGTLTALAGLRADVDTFFDKVLVNAEDPALRAARLGLLTDLASAMNKVADISKLSA